MKAERSEEDGTGGGDALHVRSKEKENLLRELTSTLAVRAERIRLQQRNEQLQTNAQKENESESRRDLSFTHASPPWSHSRPLPVPASQIPVSQARLRRRQQHHHHDIGNTTSSKGQSRPHTDISKYRPNYTWNRGGRVKELRIRYLARKFLNLWKWNVFGRVLPSQARAHYRERLMGKMFALWHVYWWELRQEWRLMVRAECHYRYVTWLKVFGAWKDFIILRTVKKAKVDRAMQQYTRRLCSKVLWGWTVYVGERRQKLALRHKAERVCAENTVRHAWRAWNEALEQKQAVTHMDSVALHFWAYRIQAQHWLVWRAAVAGRQREMLKMAGAARHSHRALVSRCFRGWVLYWRSRQTKKQYRDYSSQVHVASVKVWVFGHWYRRWRMRRALAQHQDHMTQLANCFQTRRFFCRWQNYIEEVHEERKLLQQADRHYRTHLLSLGLNAFRLCVVQRRIKGMRQNMADHLHQRQVERWVFAVWLERLEEREEEHQHLLTLKAREHYRQVLLGRAFQQMMLYKKWREHRKAQYVKADTHYYLHMAPYCLFRMKVFVQMMKNRRQNDSKALEFHRESVLFNAFSVWKQAFTHSKDVRLMERMAILHREGVVVHSYFQYWRAALAVVLQERDKEADAEAHYRAALCRSHLLAWSQHVRELKKGEEDEVKSLRHRYLTVLKRSLTAWKQYVQERRRKHMLQTRAQRHLRQRLCHQSMVAWKKYVSHNRNINSAAHKKYLAKCRQTLRWGLETWRENCKRQVADRQHEQAANVHFNRQLLTKVIQTWHRYAAIHAYKKSQTLHMVEEARQHLNTCTVRIYLRSWLKARDTAMVQRLKEERAAIHYNHNLLTSALRQWQLHHSTALRKQLLQRQSEWFLSVRLTAVYFLLWKQRLAASVEEREKSGVALWHWSLALQRKVLQAWFLYKEESLRKKQRLAAAAETRRARLVREGASQWLRVAGALAESRANLATQQQVQSASSLIQRVRRCAAHWKTWAARRAVSHRQPPPHHHLHPSSSQTAQPPSLQWSMPIASLHSMTTGAATAPAMLSEWPLPKMAASPSKLFTVSTVADGSGLARDGRLGEVSRRARPKPRRPDFLVESLQRAGLLTGHHQYADSSPRPHSPATTDTDDCHHGQQHPDGGHFGVVMATPEVAAEVHAKHTLDFSLSGEVKTGSSSTLEGDRFVRPLRFSNSADTDSTVQATTTSSTSPQHVTPASQRSQPPGNPLLQSSPISARGLAAQQNEVISDSDKVSGEDGFRSSDGEILGGNLTRPTPNDTPPVAGTIQPHSGGTSYGQTLVLMKPEDFMKKRDGTDFPPDVHSQRNPDPVSSRSKVFVPVTTPRTPRTPRSPRKSGGGSARDREGERLQGILLVKGAESDADVSPLNTARSRGTVTFASPKALSPAEELRHIRDRLRHFKEQKKKLRRMQRQQQQLSAWLQQQQDPSDTDVTQVTEELASMEEEVTALQTLVSSQRLSCEKLVARARVLSDQLGSGW